MRLFVLKDGILTLQQEELLLYKEFANIITEYTYSKAFEIFKYIYFIADYESVCNKEGFSNRKAHTHSIENCDLGTDFKVTDTIQKAIKKYKELNKNTIKEHIRNLRLAFNNSDVILTKLMQDIDERLDAGDKKDLANIILTQNQVFDLAKSLPGHLKVLKELEEKLGELDSVGKDLRRGGEEIEESMDGDSYLTI